MESGLLQVNVLDYLSDSEGRSERPVTAPLLLVPGEIAVERGRLVYRSDGWRERPQAPGMLTDFLRLGDASPDRIAAYAATWGVLGICKDGWPYTHNPPPESAGGYNGIQ